MESEELRRIFSENLTYWLDYRGKTQADLYKMAGVSSATASDWCNGKKIPRADKIVDIARWLMIELTDLMTETRNDYGEVDKLIYMVKDSEEFRNLISDIASLNNGSYEKVREYVQLLKNSERG